MAVGRSRNSIPLQDLTPDEAWQTEEARNFAAATTRRYGVDIGMARGYLEDLYGPTAHYTTVGGEVVSRFGSTEIGGGSSPMTIGQATLGEVQAAAQKQFGTPFQVRVQGQHTAPGEMVQRGSVDPWAWTHGTSQMRAMYRQLPPDISHLEGSQFNYGEQYDPSTQTRMGSLIMPTSRLGRIPGIDVRGDEIFFGSDLGKAATRQKKAIAEQTFGHFANLPLEQASLDIRTTQNVPTLMMIGGSVLPEGQSQIDLMQTGGILTNKYANIPVPSEMQREGFTPEFNVGDVIDLDASGMLNIAPGISTRIKNQDQVRIQNYGFDRNNLVIEYEGMSKDPFSMKGLGSKTVAVADPTMQDWDVTFGGRSIQPAHITQVNEAALAMAAVTSTWTPKQFTDVLGYAPKELGQKEVRGLWKGLSEQGRIAQYSFTQQAYLGPTNNPDPHIQALRDAGLASIVPGSEITEEGMRRAQVKFTGFGIYENLGEQPRGIFQFDSRYVSPEVMSDISMHDEDRVSAIRHASIDSRATAASILGASAAMHGQAPYYKTVSGNEILGDWSAIQAEAADRATEANQLGLKEDANAYGVEAQTMAILDEYTGTSGIRLSLPDRYGRSGPLIVPNPGDVMRRFGRDDVEQRVSGLSRMIPEMFGKIAQNELLQDPQSLAEAMEAVGSYETELAKQTSSAGIRQAAMGGRAPGFGGKIQALPGLAPGQMWIPERRLTGLVSEIWGKEDFGGDRLREEFKTPAEAARAMLMGETEMIPDVFALRYPSASPLHSQTRLRPQTLKQLGSALGRPVTLAESSMVPASVSSRFAEAHEGDKDDDPVDIDAGLASQMPRTQAELNRAVAGMAARSGELAKTKRKIANAPRSAEEAYKYAAGMLQSTSLAKFGEESFAIEERMGRIGPLFQAFRRAIPMGIEAQAAGTSQQARAMRISEDMITQVAGPLYGLSVDARTLPKAADELARHLSSYNVKTRGFARGEGPGFVRDLLSSEVGLMRELGQSEEISMSGGVFAGMFIGTGDKNFEEVAGLYESGAKTSELVRAIGAGKTQREVISTAPWLTAVVASGYAKAAGEDPEWAENLDEWGTGMVEKGSAARTYRSLLSRGRGKQAIGAGEFAKVTGTMIEGGMLSSLRAETDTEVLRSMGVLPTDESTEYPGLLQATNFAQRSKRESVVDRLVSAMSQEEKATMIGPQLQQAVSGDRFEDVRRTVLADYPYDPNDPGSEKAAFGRMVQASHENVTSAESDWRQRPLRAAHTRAVQANDMEAARNVNAYSESMGMTLGDQGQNRYLKYIQDQGASGSGGGGGTGSTASAAADPSAQNPSATGQAVLNRRAQAILGDMKQFAGGESVPFSQATTVAGQTTSYTRMVKGQVSQSALESVGILGGDQENLDRMKSAYQSALSGGTPSTKAEMQAASSLGSYLTAVKRVASDVSGPRGLERGYRDAADQLMKDMKASGMDTTQFREAFGNLAQATRGTDFSYASARLDEAGAAVGIGDTSNRAIQEAQGVARTYRERGKASGVSTGAVPRNMADVESELAEVTQNLIGSRRALNSATSDTTKAEQEMIATMVDKTAMGDITRLSKEAFGIGGVAGLSGFVGSKDFQMSMGMMGGGGGGGGGDGAAADGDQWWLGAATGIKRLFSPFSPQGAMVKAAWRTAVGPAFKEGIPAYGQSAFRDFRMAGMAGPVDSGGVGGGGGDILAAQSQRQLNVLASGQAAQEAWGWSQGAGPSGLAQARGVFGPALGAGAATAVGLGMGALGPVLGASAGIIGASVGALGIGIGATSYGYNLAEQTSTQYYQAAKDRSTVTQRSTSGNLIERAGSLIDRAWAAGKELFRGGGAFLRGEAPNVYAGLSVGDQMAQKGEDLFTSNFSGQTMAERALGINRAAEDMMAGDETLASYGVDAVKGALGQVIQYGGDPTSSRDLLKSTDEVRNLLARGGNYSKQMDMASALNLGPQGAADLTQFYANMPTANQAMQTEFAMQQFAPLAQMGFSGENVAQLAQISGPLTGQAANDWSKFLGRDQRFLSKAVMGKATQLPMGINLAGNYALQSQDALGLQVGTSGELSNLALGQGQEFWNRTASMPGFSASSLQTGDWSGGFTTSGSSIMNEWDGESLWGLQDLSTRMNKGVASIQSRAERSEFRRQYGSILGASPTGGQIASGRWRPGQLGSIDEVGGAYQQQRQLGLRKEALGYAQTEGGMGYTGSFGFQEQGFAMQQSQFMEQRQVSGQQMALGRSWQVQQTDWARQDLGTNYARSGTGFDWREQDIERNMAQAQSSDDYSQWQLGFQGRQTQMQRGWQTEDFAFSRSQNQLQFGWQMEDFSENIRFSTGRQRKQLLRSRERATVSQNIESGRMDTAESRAEETWAMEDEAFDKRRERLEEEQGIRDDNFETQLERLEQQREWMEEDHTRNTERLDARVGQEESVYELQESSYNLSLEHFTESFDLKMAQFDEEQKAFQANKDIATETRALNEENDLARINTLKTEMEMGVTIRESSDAFNAASTMASRMQQAQQAGVFDAFMNIISGLEGAVGNVGGYPKLGSKN